MELASWIRARLWPADDWPAELAALSRETGTNRGASGLFELAIASLACDPDRGRAFQLMREAGMRGHAAARTHAIALSRERRAQLALGELLAGDGNHAGAGCAFLAAELPELAVPSLERAVLDGGPSAARCKTLLALARGASIDVEAELEAARHATGAEAVDSYAHAIRVARLAAPDRVRAIALAAVRACRDDDGLAAELDNELLECGSFDEALDHMRARFDAAKTIHERVARMRAAAIDLFSRNVQRGLALRLVRFALDTAYDAALPEIDGHLAMWEILVGHARAQSSLPDLLPLVARGLDTPLEPDGAVYLTRLGLEITWRAQHDMNAARPYAATLLQLQPGHPLALELVAAEHDEREVPDAELPAFPVIRIATPKRAAPQVPAVAQPAVAQPQDARSEVAGATGRVVRGATPPSSGIAQRTGRLALLTPPAPPRARRVILPIDVVVELQTGAFFSTVLRDVSTSGAFMVTKRALAIESVVSLELRVPTPDQPEREVTLVAHATIVRKTDLGYGVRFVAPSPTLLAALAELTGD